MRRLRDWRMMAKMSVMGLALAAGIAPNTLTDIELGRRTPNYSTMRLISQALGVDPGSITEFATAIESHARVRNQPPDTAL